jgi:DNA (cytosine-5)-methyltransferase 1
MNDERATHLDLFSGIGGFAIAAERCGWKTVAFCEREKFAQRVLRKHWPSVPIIDDIHDLDGREYRGVSLITGGFPCQPFSQAGQQRGADDDRAIWPEMLRVIREARPRFVVGENVAGIINMALDDVLSSLEAESYSVGAVDTLAKPTSRKDNGRKSRLVGASEARKEKTGAIFGDGCENVAYTGSEGLQRRQRCGETRKKESPGGHSTECSKWTIEPDVGRVAHGIPERSHRLRGLGNAIVPQVAEQILRALIESETQ